MARQKRPFDAVQFTRESAERIAGVVRAAETSAPAAKPLTFGGRGIGGMSGKVFRVATFTGAWSIGSSKTVTFKNQTATPNTVAAQNIFVTVGNTASTTSCAIARDGTAWYLIAAECS